MDSFSKSVNPNKHLKEQFVSNLTGSSMLEIFSLSVIIPAVILLRRAIGFNFVNGCDVTQSSLKKHDNAVIPRNRMAYTATMIVDFLVVILPVLLFLTVLAEWTYAGATVLTLLLLACIVIKRCGSSSTKSLQSYHSLRTSISSYRVAMMIVTCLCILAVDFQIFPRRYAKTETYGTSWMDLGVGSFVLANALVSRQARNVSSRKWTSTLQSTFPLILLGLVRLILTAGVDYQVHVGEYGVHWNFFFTLAAVSLLTSTINVSPEYCGILGLLILTGYQICLMQGLNVYLVSNKRETDIISLNKEGIFSIFGYWGIYLVGVQLAYHLFYQNNPTAASKDDQWARTRVWVLSFLFWLVTMILDWHVERVSRRMCNLAYVTLVLAVNLQVLAILMLSEYLPGSKFTAVEEAFNLNLLGSFLLANVLTGVVNLSVDTISASSIEALVILITYAFVLCFVTGVLGFCGFRCKFW
ncbi:hypothetical protein Nepgr_030650 [Nepenthes gracilis]|uniref:Phosphatidylinositol-glycan biosynthesis class W protein n=1 Tax=Nepenthes gracilis TaxID=150966 RepID=A0AAD3TG50_NEPGR|nr:hypothetical protein Nepgr_030650 [Nepenthes gracilis]